MQNSQTDEKYRVVAPEAMHETFMSDSEEEGGTFFVFVSIYHFLSFHSHTKPEKRHKPHRNWKHFDKTFMI